MKLSPVVDKLGWNEENLSELRVTGYSFFLQGKYQIASLYFETLIRLAPESAYDHQVLGALYLESNEDEMAIEVLDHALELDPSHNPTKLNKAKALIMLDRKEEAIKLAKELMKAGDKRIANVAEALVLSHS